jgi:hypothetical protein
MRLLNNISTLFFHFQIHWKPIENQLIIDFLVLYLYIDFAYFYILKAAPHVNN